MYGTNNACECIEFLNGDDILKNLRDFTKSELEQELLSIGEKKFRATQIFAWLFRGVSSFDEMTDLSKDLIEKLKENYYINNLEVVNCTASKDYNNICGNSGIIKTSVNYISDNPDEVITVPDPGKTVGAVLGGTLGVSLLAVLIVLLM